MKAITITQLHYVVEVAQEGHFGRAAGKCHVSQPTLSMQVQKLEEDLGVTLFDRSKKPIEPTPMGHRIVAIAKNILHDVARLEEVVSGEKGEIRGPLSFGIIPTLAPYLLPRFLQAFVEKYPGVELSIEELQTEEIVRRLRENRLDLGLVAVPLAAKGITEHVIFREPFVAYLSEGHPLQKYAKLSDKRLAEPDLWLLTEGHCLRDQVLELCKARRSKDAHQAVQFESGNLETLKRLVDRKQGYTLMPYLAILDMSQRDRTKHVKEFEQPIPAREVGLIHTDSFVKNAVLKALKEEIEACLPTELTDGRSKAKVRSIPIKNSL